MYSDEDGGGGGQTETNENGNKATSSIAVQGNKKWEKRCACQKKKKNSKRK